MEFRRIISDAGVSALRNLVKMAAGIVVIPVITRLLGEGAYGIWATLISAVGLFSMVGGLHLHGALIRYRETEPEGRAFSDTLTLSLFAAAVTAAAVFIGAVGYEFLVGFTSIPAGVFVPVALLVGSRIVLDLLFNYSRAQQRVKRFEGLQVTRNLLEAAVLVVLFWRTGNIVVALWGLVGVTIVLNAALLVAYRRQLAYWPDPSTFQQYLRYGVPMVPKEAAGSLLHHADKFLVLYFLGPVATGIYAVAYTVGTVFTSATSIFNSTLYPNVVTAWENDEFEELERFYGVFVRWYVVLVIPAIVGVSFLANAVLRFISTPTIALEGAILVPVLAVAFAVQGLEFILSYPLQAAERTRLIAGITTAAVTINIIMNIAFIPVIGLLGAALATLVAFGVRTGALYWYVTDHLDLPVPSAGAARSLGATAVMAGVLFALPVESWRWQLGIYPLIGIVVFSIAFLLSGGVREDEWDWYLTKLNPQPVGYVVHDRRPWADDDEEWKYAVCTDCAWDSRGSIELTPIYKHEASGYHCRTCSRDLEGIELYEPPNDHS